MCIRDRHSNRSAHGTGLSPRPSVSVCVCIRKVYCGKTADWIRMPFGMVSGVGLGIGVLDFGDDRQRGRGIFGSEFGESHCNQWGLCTNGAFVL